MSQFGTVSSMSAEPAQAPYTQSSSLGVWARYQLENSSTASDAVSIEDGQNKMLSPVPRRGVVSSQVCQTCYHVHRSLADHLSCAAMATECSTPRKDAGSRFSSASSARSGQNLVSSRVTFFDNLANPVSEMSTTSTRSPRHSISSIESPVPQRPAVNFQQGQRSGRSGHGPAQCEEFLERPPAPSRAIEQSLRPTPQAVREHLPNLNTRPEEYYHFPSPFMYKSPRTRGMGSMVASGLGSVNGSVEEFPRLRSSVSERISFSPQSVASGIASPPSAAEPFPRLSIGALPASPVGVFGTVSEAGSPPNSVEPFPSLQEDECDVDLQDTDTNFNHRPRERYSSDGCSKYEWDHLERLSFLSDSRENANRAETVDSMEWSSDDETEMEWTATDEAIRDVLMYDALSISSQTTCHPPLSCFSIDTNGHDDVTREELQASLDYHLSKTKSKVKRWLSNTEFNDTPNTWKDQQEQQNTLGQVYGLKPRPKGKPSNSSLRAQRSSMNALQSSIDPSSSASNIGAPRGKDHRSSTAASQGTLGPWDSVSQRAERSAHEQVAMFLQKMAPQSMDGSNKLAEPPARPSKPPPLPPKPTHPRMASENLRYPHSIPTTPAEPTTALSGATASGIFGPRPASRVARLVDLFQTIGTNDFDAPRRAPAPPTRPASPRGQKRTAEDNSHNVYASKKLRSENPMDTATIVRKLRPAPIQTRQHPVEVAPQSQTKKPRPTPIRKARDSLTLKRLPRGRPRSRASSSRRPSVASLGGKCAFSDFSSVMSAGSEVSDVPVRPFSPSPSFRNASSSRGWSETPPSPFTHSSDSFQRSSPVSSISSMSAFGSPRRFAFNESAASVRSVDPVAGLIDELTAHVDEEIASGKSLREVLAHWESLKEVVHQKTGLGLEWEAVLDCLREELLLEMEEGWGC